jgi:hypothetical protein
MSSASAQYAKFREQVVADGKAYTFTDGGELLVYRKKSGETVPFWSSRSRLELVQQRFPKYRQWTITEIPFNEFWRRLDQLENEGVNVGVNWSGDDLGGYNVPVSELREGLRYWINELKRHELLDGAV